MAQTKRKRRRKHRGTQAGTIDRRGRTSRPRTRAEARAQLRNERLDRRNRPPTWRGAINRALIAAALFGALVVLLFGQKPAQAIPLALFMVLFYVPLGYFTDRFFYNRRIRQKAKDTR